MLTIKCLSLFSRCNRVVLNQINIKSSEIIFNKKISTKMKDLMKTSSDVITELNTHKDR